MKPKQKDSCKIDSDFSDCFCNVFDSFCVHDKPSKNGFLGFVVSSVFKSVLQYVIILFRKSFIVFRYIWYITIFMFCNTFLLIFDIFIFLQHSDGFDLKINFKSTKKAQPPSAELDIFYGLMCLIMGFYPTAIAFF